MTNFDQEFADCVQKRIAELLASGMDEDVAVARAYEDCRNIFRKKDSVARLTRQGVFYYPVDGQWGPVIKDFSELKKAVDKLGGKPLPTFAHHDDAGDPAKLTGVYYKIVADENTKSVYGKTYPNYPIGTQNSIGFWCDEILDASGIKHQVNIDLDHVAVSPDLVGRGGETVAVIDMADPDMKKLLEEKDAAVKAKGDEITALSEKIKATDAAIKAKDAEIGTLKAKVATDATDYKQLKERLDAMQIAAEQKEKGELVAEITKHLDPEAAKKISFDALTLADVKRMKVYFDALPKREDVKDENAGGLFPPPEKAPALDNMFKDERHEYHGNVK